jgi:pimeloyl-ACP methyl ester carboxylesterase
MPYYGDPGARIHYDLHGDPASPPLMLVHGFTASRAAFLTNLDGLAGHFYLVVPELLGHGRSDAPAEAALYRPEAAIDRLLGLGAHLGLGRFWLCGHSLGGALGLRLVLDHPQALYGFVMINSMAAAGRPPWRENSQRGMSEMAERLQAGGPATIKQTRLYPAHSRRLPPEARAALADDFNLLTADGLAGTALGLVPEVNAFERLGDVSVPMLIACGELDRPFVEALPAFRAALPAAVECVMLAGAGHAANLEAAGAFNEALLAFTRRHTV